MEVEIHQQKGDVGSGIGIAKPVIELDTVEDLYPIGQADIFHVDVAVAVPYEPFGDPFGKEGLVFGQESETQSMMISRSR